MSLLLKVTANVLLLPRKLLTMPYFFLHFYLNLFKKIDIYKKMV